MPVIDDASLIQQCLDGDESSMRLLVERFQGIVYGLCQRMLGHREDAEDVSQEVFVRVFRSLNRWDASRPFKPWLLTIAANRCRTALSRRQRTAVATDLPIEPASSDTGSESTALAEELQLALAQLREDYRMCFVLFHQQELSCAEVAEIMQCPEGTVKTWLHRARRKLADFLLRRGVVTDAGYELHRI